MAGRSLRYPPSSGLRASLASYPVFRDEIGLLAGAPQVRFVEATQGQVAGVAGVVGRLKKWVQAVVNTEGVFHGLCPRLRSNFQAVHQHENHRY